MKVHFERSSDDELEVFRDLGELAIERCVEEFKRIATLLDDPEPQVVLALILASEFMLVAERLGMRRPDVAEAVSGIVDRSR